MLRWSHCCVDWTSTDSTVQYITVHRCSRGGTNASKWNGIDQSSWRLTDLLSIKCCLSNWSAAITAKTQTEVTIATRGMTDSSYTYKNTGQLLLDENKKEDMFPLQRKVIPWFHHLCWHMRFLSVHISTITLLMPMILRQSISKTILVEHCMAPKSGKSQWSKL